MYCAYFVLLKKMLFNKLVHAINSCSANDALLKITFSRILPVLPFKQIEKDQDRGSEH